MADTLMGAHFRLQCPECGYDYQYGFVPQFYRMPAETVPPGQVPIVAPDPPPPYDKASLQTKCPSCGYYMPPTERRDVFNGDRILVLKCIYQVFEPQRWDVVVFKNPEQPKISYIKRLIGKPGEKVEIIDGDIYIDGRIERKPPKVQEELWSVIYDNDYQPVKPDVARFNGKSWKQPFQNTGGSSWQVDPQHPTVSTLDGKADKVSAMRYDPAIGNSFAAAYSYNWVGMATNTEFCSDLKVRFYVTGSDIATIGASLSKYDAVYKGYVGGGDLVITRKKGDAAEEVLRKGYAPKTDSTRPVPFTFMNTDHKLVLEFGQERLEVDMGRDPNSMGRVPARPGQPEVHVFGAGQMSLSHVAIFRDEHYISAGFRGGRGKPFTLGPDEFFMCGDNSPNSQDSRWWGEGLGNSGIRYRAGVVPREYLVGKAVFVYWPSGYPLAGSIPLLVAPDFGHLRFIYGGSDRQM
jgi:signal peptidase I